MADDEYVELQMAFQHRHKDHYNVTATLNKSVSANGRYFVYDLNFSGLLDMDNLTSHWPLDFNILRFEAYKWVGPDSDDWGKWKKLAGSLE